MYHARASRLRYFLPRTEDVGPDSNIKSIEVVVALHLERLKDEGSVRSRWNCVTIFSRALYLERLDMKYCHGIGRLVSDGIKRIAGVTSLIDR